MARDPHEMAPDLYDVIKILYVVVCQQPQYPPMWEGHKKTLEKLLLKLESYGHGPRSRT
jgi:hypothetical protein